MDKALEWCRSTLGDIEVLSDHSKEHGGHESATCRLRAPMGICYLKVHQSRSHWQNEVHGYERWAAAFGEQAPKLIAVREVDPLALVISELPGKVVDHMQLSSSQEQAVWQAAGAALVTLHESEQGEGFGPCLRDGSCVEASSGDARGYVSKRFQIQVDQAVKAGYVNDEELTTLHAARNLIPAFEGESPIPCHRDYCTANWLVDPEGVWVGVVDFEFACWDVRVADFSRYPEWSWMDRPGLIDAFFDGYGRSLTAKEEQQLLFAHVEYALGAIIWGRENAYFGFEREGRESLAHLRSSIVHLVL